MQCKRESGWTARRREVPYPCGADRHRAERIAGMCLGGGPCDIGFRMPHMMAGETAAASAGQLGGGLVGRGVSSSAVRGYEWPPGDVQVAHWRSCWGTGVRWEEAGCGAQAHDVISGALGSACLRTGAQRAHGRRVRSCRGAQGDPVVS